MTTVRAARNVWLVRAAALAIFVLGFAAGALAPAAYRAWTRPVRGDRIERLAERLKLSAGQKEQVRQVFGETRTQLEALRRESEPRIAEIRRQADERLQRALTPEQWRQLQQEREESRGGRRRGREGGGGGDR